MIEPKQWWAAEPEFDEQVRARFQHLHEQAARGELYAWRAEPRGRLAEIIVLDQFSRNIFRDRPEAFAADAMALVLAQEAVAAGADHTIDPPRRAFLYMPYMHSESPAMQALAVGLFAAPGLERNLDFARRHQAIIERFGRYPHRNAILGRQSTPDELEFLKTSGSAF